MRGSHPPKAILFDIGGVVVASPFQAILDYEIASGILPGWINFSISRSAPNGAFQRLERGEIQLDERFFKGFRRDLHAEEQWKEFWEREHRKRDTAKDDGPSSTPPIPQIDVEWLFWEMMRVSRTPEPDIYPALLKLEASNRFIIAALSNTVIFPADHPYSSYNGPNSPFKSHFDVFISSAHIGLRKPDPRAYECAIDMLDDCSRKRGMGGIKAEEVLFLDDIGENLKVARKRGMRTLKVGLGRGREAVEELERVLGMSLRGGENRGKL